MAATTEEQIKLTLIDQVSAVLDGIQAELRQASAGFKTELAPSATTATGAMLRWNEAAKRWVDEGNKFASASQLAAAGLQATGKGSLEAASKIGGVGGAISGAVGKLISFGSLLKQAFVNNVVNKGMELVAAAFNKIKDAMITGNAEFERYEVQFGVLLGSTDLAKKRLEDLAEFGAKTPFELPEVVRADKVLQSFGLHAADVGQRFGMTGEQIRTVAGDVASGTGQSFEEISTYLGKFSSGATGEAIARFQELGIITRKEMAEMGLKFSKSGELLSPLDQSMTVLLAAMKKKFGGMMDAQSSTFEGMMSNLQDWFGQAGRLIGGPIFDVLKEQLGGLLTVLNSSEAQATLTTFATNIAGAIRTVMSYVAPLVDGFRALLMGGNQAGVGIFAIFSTLAKIFGSSSQEATAFGLKAQAIFFQVRDAIANAIDWVVTNWPIAQQAATDAFNAIGAAVETYVVPVLNVLVQAATWVYEAIAQKWPAVQAVAEKVFAAIGAIIQTVVIPVFEFLLARVTDIVNFFITNWPLIAPLIETVAGVISNLVDKVITNFGKSVDTVLPIALTVFETVFGAIQTVVETVAGAIGTIVTGLLKALNGDVEGGMNDIKNLFVTAWNSIVAFFEEITPKMIATGTDIINGLYNGMLAAGEKIKGFLTGLIKEALGKFADFLDMHSPSRLMYYYGNMTVFGYAMGIQDSQHMVNKAMSQMGQNGVAAFNASVKQAVASSAGGVGSAVAAGVQGRSMGTGMLPDGGYTTPTTTGSVAADLDAHERAQQGGAVVIEMDGERVGSIVLGGGRGAGTIFRETARAGG